MSDEDKTSSLSPLEALLQELAARQWMHHLSGFATIINRHAYTASITRPTPHGGPMNFTARGDTPFEALSTAYTQVMTALPDPETPSDLRLN